MLRLVIQGSGFAVYQALTKICAQSTITSVVYTSTMPNGSPEITEAEWTKIREFFDKISGTLSDFASRHNLAVVEYYHESPSWSFRFQHPKGGGATVNVERLNDS